MHKSSVISVFIASCALILQANDDLDQAQKLEKSGDAHGARMALAAAVQRSPEDVAVLTAQAEFLDRYGDPDALSAYRKLLAASPKAGGTTRADIARRIVVLELLAGDRAAAARDLVDYREAGGTDWPASPPWKAEEVAPTGQTIHIPGPLRSFNRMAAIPMDLPVAELLPALARNVVTSGYQAMRSNEALEQTEYLKLVHRYLSQARELEKLAGADKAIRIENCESAKAGELLRIIGYRMRGGCGSEVVLETVNASRAFLTTDSGFPLVELEQALRTNRPFVQDYQSASIPVLYGAEYWLSAEKEGGEFIDAFLGDPALCRLYLGLAKLDRQTAEELRKAVPIQRLRAFAHVLDYFGGLFEIREGKAVVPGGARSEAAWAELVGVSPAQGAGFFDKLLSKDDGWLASLFDSLARIGGPVKEYLTEPERMKRFYAAVRGKVTSPGPARPVFRSNADMMLLTTRLRVDASGHPLLPGNVDVWRRLFVAHPNGKYDSKLTKSAAGWKEQDDVLEALFALCRKVVENEPLRIFMAVSDLDRNRAQPLEAATVDRLTMVYHLYGAQYSLFNDAPSLTDRTIVQYLDTADALSHIRDSELRADTIGTLQALAGIWQIFCRQGSIPAARADATLSQIIAPFAAVKRARDVFEAGREGIKLLLSAAGSADPAAPQDRMIELLSGTAAATDTDTQAQLIQEMNRILDAQKSVSLNQIFLLDANLEGLTHGGKLDTALATRIASRVAEIQLPRSPLTGVERNAFSFGYWTERHVETERKMNLRAAIDRAGADAEKLKDVRGLLAPFLRDTLVAMNYAHYAPPGAQVLYTNPAFVRGHDFIGTQGATNSSWKLAEPFGTGWPSNGGGRLSGSLAGLPYALAEAEQNFLVPAQTQALIWTDLVPQLILSAKIPRWWNVTPQQMHWVGLHLRYAKVLMGESVMDPAVRKQALEIVSRQAAPARTRDIARLLEEGNVQAALEKLTPSEMFVLASEMSSRRKSGDPVAAEMLSLSAGDPERVNYAAISRAFGTPKPTLTNSYRPELLNLRTFPTLMGYSSRIMAESWESNTLYWAALADELHSTPAQLNVLIPEWTQKVVERIFASHLEDWPALLRSLRTVGDDIRARYKPQALADQKAALQ
jgi:hypothetical protein